MVLFKFLERSLGLVSTLILARLLVPADFGLVAMAMSVLALVELASAFSFELQLIQRPNPSRAHYDTAWTLNVAFAVACSLIVAVLAQPSAVFYGEPRLTAVMLVLAAGWFVQGFENIGVVNFRREMNFSREFAFLLGKKLPAFVVTVALAAALESYWALVAGSLVGRITSVVLSYVMQPYRPRFSLVARSDLFSFSSWLFVNNLLNFAAARLSHFVVGRIHGASALGLYTVGWEIAYLPTTEFVAPINRATFPGYSRMATDLVELRRGFVDVAAVIAAFALPASVGLAVVSEPLVLVFLGGKWIGAVPIVQILALAGGISAVMSNTYSVYLALGRPSVLTVVKLGELAVLIPGMVILSRTHGVVGVAYAELIAISLVLILSLPLLCRALSLSIFAYFASIWRPIAAAAVMGTGVSILVELVSHAMPSLTPLLVLSVAVSAGVGLYVAVLILLWLLSGRPQGAETQLLARAGAIWASARTGRQGVS